MDTSDTHQELQKLRERVHDIAEVVHTHGSKIEICKLEVGNLKEAVENIVSTTATREVVKSESAILQLKIDQVSSDVGGMKRNLNTVTLTVILAVIGAVITLVLK